MKKAIINFSTGAMALASIGVHASPDSNGGVLTINGRLTGDTCEISGEGQGPDFTVNLPRISVNALTGVGATAGSTGFTIALTNCNPASSKVHTFWPDGVNTLTDGNLKNNGTATQVEVQLVDYNSGSPQVLDLSQSDGAQNSHSTTIVDGAANLRYAAQYYSAASATGPGTVTTDATFTIVYE